MNQLELREAKRSFSAVVNAAELGEPTIIVKDDRPLAVVFSYSEWTRLQRNVPSLAELLLAIPALEPDDLHARRPARVVHDSALD